MPGLNDIIAVSGAALEQARREGAASRDTEIADLEQRLAAASGDAPDGYTVPDAGTSLQTAVDKGPVFLRGDWPLSASLKLSDGAAIWLAPGARILRGFKSSGATRAGLIVNRDWTRPAQNVTIRGGGNIEAAQGMTGNLISLWADDLVLRDWTCGYWSGGRLFMGGGERLAVTSVKARCDTSATSGSGGLRVSVGSGTVAGCDIWSGDDVFQAVPAGGDNDPLRNVGDIHDLTYMDCVGKSFSARLMVCGLQGVDMTASIRDVTFERVTGFGGGSGVNIANHAPSSGSITAVRFTDCTVDQSQTLSPTQGQPGDVFVLRESGTGPVDGVDLSGLRVLNPRPTKQLFVTKGAVGSIIPPAV